MKKSVFALTKHRKLVSSLFAAAPLLGAGLAFTPGGSNEAYAVMSYECWTHPGGKPDKMVHVLADSKAEAVELAIKKFRSLDVKPIAVTCK